MNPNIMYYGNVKFSALIFESFKKYIKKRFGMNLIEEVSSASSPPVVYTGTCVVGKFRLLNLDHSLLSFHNLLKNV